MPIDDEQAIRELIATWVNATADGDVPKVLDLISDDVVLLTPGNRPMSKADFEAGFRSFAGKARFDSKVEVREIQVSASGEMAFSWVHLEVAITRPGADRPTRREGYAMSVLRKQPAGNWVIARDANILTVVENS